MRISKQLFVNNIAEKSGLSVHRTNQILDLIMNEIKEIIANGDFISFWNFGKFGSIKRRKIRIREFGGVEKEYEERILPRFWVSGSWKKNFNIAPDRQ